MPVTLTATEFEVAWETLRLGDLPLIFRVRVSRPGSTDEHRALVVETAMDALRGRGLAGARGVSAGLADALTLLANPLWVVDARLDLDRPVRAYGAAGHGDAAAIAALDGETMTITSSSRYRLPADVAALAGDPPPGPGRSMNVPLEAMLEAGRRSGGDPHLLGDELVELGVPVGDARMIAKLGAELSGCGQFGVDVVDHDGGSRRAPRVIGFCDTPHGRWAQLRTVGADGQQWLTFTPARLGRLASMIAELLAESGVRAA